MLIPVFPGTNCEYDTARVFERNGADVSVFVVKNQNSAQIEESIQAFNDLIKQSQIIMIPGGFSGGRSKKAFCIRMEKLDNGCKVTHISIPKQI